VPRLAIATEDRGGGGYKSFHERLMALTVTLRQPCSRGSSFDPGIRTRSRRMDSGVKPDRQHVSGQRCKFLAPNFVCKRNSARLSPMPDEHCRRKTRLRCAWTGDFAVAAFRWSANLTWRRLHDAERMASGELRALCARRIRAVARAVTPNYRRRLSEKDSRSDLMRRSHARC